MRRCMHYNVRVGLICDSGREEKKKMENNFSRSNMEMGNCICIPGKDEWYKNKDCFYDHIIEILNIFEIIIL